MYKNEKNSEDLKLKSKSALKQILQKSLYIESIEPLLHDAPANIMKYVLGQFSKVRDDFLCLFRPKSMAIFFLSFFYSQFFSQFFFLVVFIAFIQ